MGQTRLCHNRCDVSRRKNIGLVVAISAAAVLVLIMLFFRWKRQTKQTANTKMVKLTDGTGLTADPAISADGKLIAYASIEDPLGNVNIGLKNWGRQSAVQLTHDDVDADDPTFSPDDTKIAFRSKKDGGGIYLVPVIGGEGLSFDAVWPKHVFPGQSMDGYWSGGSDAQLFQPSKERARSLHGASAGGEPKRLGSDLSTADPVGVQTASICSCTFPRRQATRGIPLIGGWLPLMEVHPREQITSARLRARFFAWMRSDPRLSQWSNSFITFAAGFRDAVNTWRAQCPLSDASAVRPNTYFGHDAGDLASSERERRIVLRKSEPKCRRLEFDGRSGSSQGTRRA